jgi:RNA polymerase sigma-70 factor (ECF subfamily)
LAGELADQVQECLAELSEIQREVLLLHMAGHKLQEIADILGIPRATAGTRLFHARERLRACLEALGYHLD